VHQHGRVPTVVLANAAFDCFIARKCWLTVGWNAVDVISWTINNDVRDDVRKALYKTILIEVWASWCSDCVKAMPKVKEIQKENTDVVYIFISMDKSFEKWNEGIKKHEVKGENYWVNDEKGMKGEFGQSIDLDWIPRYIVVRDDMKVTLYRAIEKDFDKINKELKL
jgi:thiol-disulfide isomerase/thioredoxin